MGLLLNATLCLKSARDGWAVLVWFNPDLEISLFPQSKAARAQTSHESAVRLNESALGFVQHLLPKTLVVKSAPVLTISAFHAG
jgi:hypothetical protein